MVVRFRREASRIGTVTVAWSAALGRDRDWRHPGAIRIAYANSLVRTPLFDEVRSGGASGRPAKMAAAATTHTGCRRRLPAQPGGHHRRSERLDDGQDGTGGGDGHAEGDERA